MLSSEHPISHNSAFQYHPCPKNRKITGLTKYKLLPDRAIPAHPPLKHHPQNPDTPLMSWKSIFALSTYIVFICTGLAVMARLWWISRQTPGHLASLEERLRATLMPNTIFRRMLTTGIHFSAVVVMVTALMGGLGGWWYKSIMNGFSDRLTETFKEADVVTFTSPEALTAPTSPYEQNESDSDNDDGIEASKSFSFNLGTEEGDGEIYEEIIPKLKPRKLEFGKISVTYEGKRAKILTRKDEVFTFISRILAEPVEIRKTHVDAYSLYSLKTKAPVFMTFEALKNAEKYFRDDVTETKRWIWQMFRFGIFLILPLLFLAVCIIKGVAEWSAQKTKQNDLIKALLKSGPIKWEVCPEAKLRRLPFPANLQLGPWSYGVQVRNGLQHHIRVYFRKLSQTSTDATSPKGRLLSIRAGAQSAVDRYHVFIPDDMIPEINEFHAKTAQLPPKSTKRTA